MLCPDSRCNEVMLPEGRGSIETWQGQPVVAQSYNCTCGISVVVNTPANYEDRYHKDAD